MSSVTEKRIKTNKPKTRNRFLFDWWPASLSGNKFLPVLLPQWCGYNKGPCDLTVFWLFSRNLGKAILDYLHDYSPNVWVFRWLFIKVKSKRERKNEKKNKQQLLLFLVYSTLSYLLLLIFKVYFFLSDFLYHKK